MPGVYVHIPFCRRACSYCDFHFSTSLGNLETVMLALNNEVELRHEYLPKNAYLNSIYFGGGTPSLLPINEFKKLMKNLARFYRWDDKTEITLEANPDDITRGILREWKLAGINRLSIGLQSFNELELRWMNRAHNASQSEEAVKMAQDHGFENISIDLIYGSKFQDEKTWEKTLKKAAALNTTHISSYNLTIEDRTALSNKIKKGLEPAVDEQLSARQFLMMRDMLTSSGYLHYEISNFAKPGFLAVHNSNYWLQEHYLGLGPSAHSFNGHSRQWNIKNNSRYSDAIKKGEPFFEKEELTSKQMYNEYVMTSLRTDWGADERVIKDRFGEEVVAHFKNTIKKFSGLYSENNGKFVLNSEGRLRTDGITSALFLV